MAIKKQVIVLSVLYNDEETPNGRTALTAIEHKMFNIDGIMEWDSKVVSEESLSADLTDEDMEELKRI